MRNLIYVLAATLFLTGCPKEEEIQDMEDGIADKKAAATTTIQTRDYSLDGLIRAQEYFFDFSEKVHLMIIEPDSAKNIKKLINKKGIQNFCSVFVVPIPLWRHLESYCSSGPFYKCSPEIKEYENTLIKFKDLIGPDAARLFNNEPKCNN